MNEKILIFGNGQLGNFYLRHFEDNKIPAKIVKADITNIDTLEKEFDEHTPTVVINTAAKTNLEWCSLNKMETFNVNVLGADNLAQLCDRYDAYFVHLSSGCIFESLDENDYKKEADIPNPSAFYAWTKVWAEQIIKFDKSDGFEYVILRPRQPISSEFSYKNMLVKLLTFTQFVDTPNTGTVIEDLMVWTDEIIEKKFVGTVHVANEGYSTPYKIGLMLKKHVLPSLEINKITKQELDKITPNRRVDTLLDVSLLKSIVSDVQPYEKRLEETIINLGNNIKDSDKELLQTELDKTLEQSKTRAAVNECWKDLLK